MSLSGLGRRRWGIRQPGRSYGQTNERSTWQSAAISTHPILLRRLWEISRGLRVESRKPDGDNPSPFRPRWRECAGGACCSSEGTWGTVTRGGDSARGTRVILPRAMICSPFRALDIEAVCPVGVAHFASRRIQLILSKNRIRWRRRPLPSLPPP